jgi:glycosyltransferase involved in cell wall biosynthesis
MADPAQVSIVIPAYNEASRSRRRSRPARARPWREIIVVDDGSATAPASAPRRRRDRRAHPYNMGNGAAVKSGIRRATGELRPDHRRRRTASAEDALRSVARLGEYDLVIGARSRRRRQPARRAGNGALNGSRAI